MKINRGRVFLGGFVGSIAWAVWGRITDHFIVGTARYATAQNVGHILKSAHYRTFMGEWIVLLFVASVILTYLYASLRPTLGPGPVTALKIGLLVGFIADFPLTFAQATWEPIDRIFALGTMVGIWGGCILATVVAGWLYKD